MEKICKHCKGKIAIRNPKGFCDHLYYPDNCVICKEEKPVKMQVIFRPQKISPIKLDVPFIKCSRCKTKKECMETLHPSEREVG